MNLKSLSNQFLTFNHKTTNLVFPNFFHEVFSVEQTKKSLIILTRKKIEFSGISFLLQGGSKLKKSSSLPCNFITTKLFWHTVQFSDEAQHKRSKFKIKVIRSENFDKMTIQIGEDDFTKDIQPGDDFQKERGARQFYGKSKFIGTSGQVGQSTPPP